jgi:hypothetical protein
MVQIKHQEGFVFIVCRDSGRSYDVNFRLFGKLV